MSTERSITWPPFTFFPFGSFNTIFCGRAEWGFDRLHGQRFFTFGSHHGGQPVVAGNQRQRSLGRALYSPCQFGLLKKSYLLDETVSLCTGSCAKNGVLQTWREKPLHGLMGDGTAPGEGFSASRRPRATHLLLK